VFVVHGSAPGSRRPRLTSGAPRIARVAGGHRTAAEPVGYVLSFRASTRTRFLTSTLYGRLGLI
jgi:hypothetical protein